MKNSILLALSLALLCFTGCDKKEILKGKREAIPGLAISEKISISQDIKSSVISPKPLGSLSEYVDISGNKQHVSINHRMNNDPKIIWKTSIGRYPINTDIIAFGENIYAVDANGTLNCVSQKTGEIIWKKNIAKQPDEAAFSGGMTANNGIIFVGTNIGTVIAINSKDQKEVWNKKLKKPVKGAPLYIDGKLIVTTIDNQTQALDSTNGNVVWTKTLNAEDTLMSEASTPGVSGEDIICAYSSGDIASINHKTGSENWSDVLFSSDVSESGFVISHIAASPVITGEYIFAATSISKAALLDLATGTRLWDQSIGTLTTPVINNNWIFILTHDNNVVCLSLENGSAKWETRLLDYFKEKRYDSYRWSGPLMINGDIVVFSENGDVVRLDISTGKVKKQNILEKVYITRTPVIINQKMFAITSRADIYAIE